MLGRGLEALIPTSKGDVSSHAISEIKQDIKREGEEIIKVPLEKIESDPNQPRKSFSYSELEELINSIRIYGIIQPLILCPIREGRYQIIAGERRFRAAKFLELETVPAIIREANKQQKLEIALLENIQRKDLNPIERAEAYFRLSEEFNLTQEEIANRLGKSRSSVANTLRLLSLPSEVQEAIRDEKISEAHGKVLAGIDDPEKQSQYLKRILGLDLSVKETEKMIKKRGRRVAEIDPMIAMKVQKISDILGIKIRFCKKAKGGNLVFEIKTEEDLYKFLDKLEQKFK